MLETKGALSISFIQEQVMVLPMMKMVHLIGEIHIGTISQPIAFQLAYDFNKYKELRLKGKQAIRLTDFGIVIPQELQGEIKNEININLDIKMIEEKIANTKALAYVKL